MSPVGKGVLGCPRKLLPTSTKLPQVECLYHLTPSETSYEVSQGFGVIADDVKASFVPLNQLSVWSQLLVNLSEEYWVPFAFSYGFGYLFSSNMKTLIQLPESLIYPSYSLHLCVYLMYDFLLHATVIKWGKTITSVFDNRFIWSTEYSNA